MDLYVYLHDRCVFAAFRPTSPLKQWCFCDFSHQVSPQSMRVHNVTPQISP